MSYQLTFNDQKLEDIELIVLDLSNTVFDFTELWLKEVGYISQVLAENYSTIQGELFRKRAMLVKTLGINPETGEIDPNGTLFQCSTSEIKTLLKNVLYLNNVSPFEAETGIEKVFNDMITEIDPAKRVTLLPDAELFIQNASKALPIVSLSKRSYENSNQILNHFNLESTFKKNYTLFNADHKDLYHLEQVILFDICNDLSIEPENVLLIADNIYDLCVHEDLDLHRILVSRVSINDFYLKKYQLNNIISSLEDISIL